MLSRCSWIAFHFANLSPVWLSTLVPAVWCGLATSFTFFCPSDVRPLRFLDLLTGCFSSLRMVAEDLCCLLVLSSAALCKLWQCSLLFCSTEDSVGLSFCAQICLGKFRKIQTSRIMSRHLFVWQTGLSACESHLLRWSISIPVPQSSLASSPPLSGTAAVQVQICQLQPYTMDRWAFHVAGVLLCIALAGMTGKRCTLWLSCNPWQALLAVVS